MLDRWGRIDAVCRHFSQRKICWFEFIRKLLGDFKQGSQLHNANEKLSGHLMENEIDEPGEEVRRLLW